ncbi:hypothetical protein PR048_012914 [Dryococelus australis]|uniref:Uncharacterized protein n=1 Tax=Dryococelus australis TaxID=614101 RepID=A0ABQ9HR46_9NEOP|nr:hypothetical protein PR048_012914 [Dryococelus australis]
MVEHTTGAENQLADTMYRFSCEEEIAKDEDKLVIKMPPSSEINAEISTRLHIQLTRTESTAPEMSANEVYIQVVQSQHCVEEVLQICEQCAMDSELWHVTVPAETCKIVMNFAHCHQLSDVSSLSSPCIKNIVKVLDSEFILHWGYTKKLWSDNGKFLGKRRCDHCSEWRVNHLTTEMYHPRAIPTEWRNQMFKALLQLHVGNERTLWADHLPATSFSLHSHVNEATGQFLAEILYEYDLALPGKFQCPPQE